MTISVTRSSELMIPPSESTPSTTLNLSIIDSLPELRVSVSTAYVYKHCTDNAAQVVREALSKVLVPYYPLGGRLREKSDGLLQVICTGEGAWFIEASANCSLDSVNYFDNLELVPDDIFPTPPPESYDPILQIQVTRFTCGGVVFVIKCIHSVCDGVGVGNFLNAMGEFGRGFMHPTVAPTWQRDVIPSPTWLVSALGALKQNPQPSPYTGNEQLEHVAIDLPLEEITKLKKNYMEHTAGYCSMFDVAAASVWRERARAIGFERDTILTLIFPINTRQFIDPPLPESYYGNCIHIVRITSSSVWLVESSIEEIVKLIKEGKARSSIQFKDWLKDEGVSHNENVIASLSKYTILILSDWTGLGFNTIDFGWGVPVHVFPGYRLSPSAVPFGIVGLLPAPKKGIRIETWCVKSTHLPSLVQSYKKMALSRL